MQFLFGNMPKTLMPYYKEILERFAEVSKTL